MDQSNTLNSQQYKLYKSYSLCFSALLLIPYAISLYLVLFFKSVLSSGYYVMESYTSFILNYYPVIGILMILSITPNILLFTKTGRHKFSLYFKFLVANTAIAYMVFMVVCQSMLSPLFRTSWVF